MSNNFKVLVIAHDFAGFKKGNVYVCRDNEYYSSNDIYNKQFHKDLLSKENPNLDFELFSKAEYFVKEKLGITGDLYNVWVNIVSGFNDYSIITCYVSKVLELYYKLQK
jgi:hypothetical protein